MKQFLSVEDVDKPASLVDAAIQMKAGRKSPTLGLGLTLALIFFNSSLRTRLSSQRAAQLLGMESLVLDVANSWPLEFGLAKVMDQDKSEHVKEAAQVISQYCEVLGIRSFPSLENRERDYQEPVISAFTEYSQVPLINLESATRHPLQGLTDMMTISEYAPTSRPPKVLLTWAPHPKALPQSVANSFIAWSKAMNHDLVIAHPEGYDLDEKLVGDTKVVYDPIKAYEGVDFVYAKNWSSFKSYGRILSSDPIWKVNEQKMERTNGAYFMHCLPVRRNVVVDDAVIDDQNSLVIKQANNRTYAAMAVISALLNI